MINRLQHFIDQAPKTARFTDYYAVEALTETYVVSFATALYVELQLEVRGPLDLIEFVDVFGIAHRVPAVYIHRVTEARMPHGQGMDSHLVTARTAGQVV